MIQKKMTFIKTVVFVLSLAIGVGVAHHYVAKTTHSTIYKYDAARDTADMLALFKHDTYWLSNREYDQDRQRFLFETYSPNEYEPRYFGKMGIQVMRDASGAFIGFVTYYMKNFHEGIIFFLAVRPEFRGKHYGEQLLNAGIAQLVKQGAKIVSLAVRVDNEKAIKLYTRAGMHEASRADDGFARMEKVVQ